MSTLFRLRTLSLQRIEDNDYLNSITPYWRVTNVWLLILRKKDAQVGICLNHCCTQIVNRSIYLYTLQLQVKTIHLIDYKENSYFIQNTFEKCHLENDLGFRTFFLSQNLYFENELCSQSSYL